MLLLCLKPSAPPTSLRGRAFSSHLPLAPTIVTRLALSPWCPFLDVHRAHSLTSLHLGSDVISVGFALYLL